MRSRFTHFAILLLTSFAATAVVDAKEPTSLFDGKTLKGWRGYKKAELKDNWTVKDGAIHGSGKGSDLISEEQFGNFELQFEWKIAPGGNSGVIYRCTEEGKKSHNTGPEFQLLDDKKQTARLKDNPTIASAGLYGLYGSNSTELKPLGEFNTARIIVDGKSIEHWLNGEKVVECVIDSDDWKKKVAASKFSKWKGFARSPKGHLALQSHGSPIWFRNIKVRELPEK